MADAAEPLSVEDIEVDPRILKRQTVNARFMTKAQMDRLVDNVKRDGTLTSTVLLYRDPKSGDLEILSGHHRTEAAILANLPTIKAQVITTPLSDERKAAIQLSHNAISGQDDPSTLATLYAGLDLDLKLYSGLDDDVLQAVNKVELAGLDVGVQYQEMHLFFLPEDHAAVATALKSIDKAARRNEAFVAAYADFDRFFEAAVQAKTKHQAFNSAISVRLMADLALERLAQIEAEDQPAGAEAEAD